MKFSFDKYRIPYPFLDAPDRGGAMAAERTFMPDQVLDALHEQLLPVWPACIAAYDDLIDAGYAPSLDEGRVVVPGIILSWDETLAAVEETLQAVDPGMAAQFRMTKDRNWIDLLPASATYQSRGMCVPAGYDERDVSDGRPATIEFEYDGTVNDPVYLAHEMGHMIESFESQGRGSPPKNVTEIQAFFLQEAHYDPALHPGRSREINDALRRHRMASAMLTLHGVSGEIGKLQSFIREHEKDVGRLDEAYGLHCHRPAHVLAVAFYKIFSSMTALEKKYFLSTLYGRERETTLEDLFAAAGIDDEDALKSFVRTGLNEFLNGITPVFQTAPSISTRRSFPSPSI